MPTGVRENLFRGCPPNCLSVKDETQQKVEEVSRCCAELLSQIEQLRLVVQTGMDTPCSSTTSLPPPAEPVFLFKNVASLPTYTYDCTGDSTTSTRRLYDFVTTLERAFKLRNYELQLPADSTEGWVNYAAVQLRGAAEDRMVSKWGTSPNTSWKVFRKWLIDSFTLDKWVQDINRDYSTFDCKTYDSHGNITTFNNKFREYRLLLSFLGRDMSQEEMLKDYETKITKNNKVAVALKQFMTVEKMVGQLESVKLEDIMKYCENVHHTG